MMLSVVLDIVQIVLNICIIVLIFRKWKDNN